MDLARDLANMPEPLGSILRELWGIHQEVEVRPTDMEELMKHLRDNVSRDNETIQTFFAKAIERNESEVIQCLVENGVSVNLSLNELQLSPLHLAVKKAQLDMVELLLQHQANIHAVDANGWTALHHASVISPAIMSDVFQPIHREPRDSLSGSYRSNNVLLEKVISILDRSLEIFRLLINSGCNVNTKDQHGFTPLYNIFDDRSIRFIKPQIMDGAGSALAEKLKVAKIRSLKTEMINQVRAKQCLKLKLLLDHGADVETRFGENEDTILHVLIRDLETSRNFEHFESPCFVDRWHAEMAKEILNLKLVDVNVTNNKGMTPIVMAVSLLSADIVRILVEHGAELSDVEISQFVYPKTPPCLEAVENLLDIVAMRRSEGCPLSLKETLAVLQFFMACNFDTHLQDYDLNRKFREFLNFGTEDVIIKMLKTVTENLSKYPNIMFMIIHCESEDYLLKMRKCGLPLSKDVESLLMKHIMPRLTSVPNPDKSEVLTVESHRMKSLNLMNNDKSLQDILHLPSNQMYSFLKNNEHKESLKTNFVFTSSIIQGFFARCLIRQFALEIANDNLRLILKTLLPDLCYEKISKYLDNWDILNLLKATNIPFKSPKASRNFFAVSYSLPDHFDEIALNPLFVKMREMNARG